MKYEDFSGILNRVIFAQSKAKLLESIAQHPQRYVGLLRPTKPKAKIVQNLLQSHEIRMGDALEKIVEGYLLENRFVALPKSIMIDGNRKELDLHFSRGEEFYFAEMKVRDDHDSTKRRGQMDDFRAKVQALAKKRDGARLCAMLFFVDPGLKKNRKFYAEYLADVHANSGASVDLLYGNEFFEKLVPDANIWAELESHLKRWRDEIPVFPEVNFDKDAAASAEELRPLALEKAAIFRKIFRNEEVRREILPILFPTGETLDMLRGHVQDAVLRNLIEAHIRSAN